MSRPYACAALSSSPYEMDTGFQLLDEQKRYLQGQSWWLTRVDRVNARDGLCGVRDSAATIPILSAQILYWSE
jgi:hypothetical protein